MGDYIYFTADDATLGKEVWAYNTQNGTTTLLKDVNTTPATYVTSTSSDPKFLTVSGGKLFWSAGDASYGSQNVELWVSDGTPQSLGGNPHIINVNNTSGTASSSPTGLVDVGNTLYFTANDGTGLALWKSDGGDVGAGTVKVTNNFNGTGYTFTAFSNAMNVGGTLMFTGTANGYGTELFKVNGSGVIELVKDFNGTSANSTFSSLAAVGTKLYAVANSALWQSDGTTGGTVQVANSLTLTAPSNLTNVGGTLMFTGTTVANGTELFKVVDGAPGSIALVQDFNHLATNSGVTSLTAVGTELYVAANDGTGLALWHTNGTFDAATKVTNTAGVTAFANLANINGTLFFAGTSATTGQELYNVQANSVTLVKDLYFGTASSSPTALTNVSDALGTKLVFTANGWAGGYNDGATGNEPWVYDATAGTTTLVKDLNLGHPLLNSGDPTGLTNVNGIFYWFQYVDQHSRNEIVEV